MLSSVSVDSPFAKKAMIQTITNEQLTERVSDHYGSINVSEESLNPYILCIKKGKRITYLQVNQTNSGTELIVLGPKLGCLAVLLGIIFIGASAGVLLIAAVIWYLLIQNAISKSLGEIRNCIISS